MTDKERAAELLGQSADYLENGPGWCQGQFESWKGQCCSVGVLNALYDKDYEWEARCMARNALRTVIDSNIVWWNDQPTRTKEEVIAAFREAEARLRNGEL